MFISMDRTYFVPADPGVPYQVRVAAASLGGFGSPAIENCFSRQLGELLGHSIGFSSLP